MRDVGRRLTGWRTRALAGGATLALLVIAAGAALAAPTGWKIIGWNNLGMHCMDADFSVFAILPPYNTIQAHVIDPTGKLVKSAQGITVTYQAVADPQGSVNTSSIGKTDFWQHVGALFGVALPPDAGLAGKNMPGPGNTPKTMTFDPAMSWFIAEGIPITPYDDAHAKNYYPMMRLVARDTTGAVLATTDIVLPVSDEMDCTSCHGSASGNSLTRPAGGWANDPDPQRDYRRNILRLHDDLQLGQPAYTAALAALGYSASGLAATADGGTAVLCAGCHLSEALPGSGRAGIPPLTAAMHARHANVIDPTNGMTLETSANRSACYSCHPGSETRCLRGAMGNAVASDGTMAIQCQNCHGPMSAVGASTRTGWFDEPTCQQCHTGTAVHNNGLIRYTSALEASGLPRQAVDATFATNANTPLPGTSLYRFSAGHGGLQCEACHGATHAEYPSSHGNDNVQSTALQGHAGTLGECTSCHGSSPSTTSGGPHGMHPVGQAWVSRHDDVAEGSGSSQCRSCHGADYRGTVLSRAFATRTITSEKGNLALWRGFQVGCYGCHNGPNSESRNSNRPAVVSNTSASTPAGVPVSIALAASDADGNALTLRVVGQPRGGTAGLSGRTATYFPFDGFTGTDTFTFAAWDGSIDSNLGTVTVTVTGAPPCTLGCSATAPASGVAGTAVSFQGSATPSSCTGTPTYAWSFGDGSGSTQQSPSHVYAIGGTYSWTMTASLGGVTCSRSGSITIAGTVSRPRISSIRASSEPFRLQINGSGFLPGAAVFIGSDGAPWPSTSVVSSSRIVLSGSNLSDRFPRRVRVTIRVVNPDGGTATGSYRR